MAFWNQKTFCLITGASKGIGRTIAVEFSKNVGPHSVFLLVARSAEGLEGTKAEMLAQGKESIQVITAAVDLGKPIAADFLSMIGSALVTSGTSPSDFQHSILIHNAGSLGNIALRVTEMEDIEELRQIYEFNVLSLIVLTSQFFKVFPDLAQQRSVVQITSLAALSPFKSLGSYCAGKAARDMLMKVIAEEDPSISTLSYAPGPVDTDMYTEVIDKSGNEETLAQFVETKEKGHVLTPIQTVTKLVRILGEKKYRKGEHVDYFDIE